MASGADEVLEALPPHRRRSVVEVAVARRAPSFVAQQAPQAPPTQQSCEAPPIDPPPIDPPPASTIDPAHGAERALTVAAFDALAVRDDVPGAPQLRTVKFLITGVDGAAPTLYLIQTQRFGYHFDFAQAALGVTDELEAWNAITYFRDDRANLAGTILHHAAHAPDAPLGLYAVEFWPTDPVTAAHIALAYQLIAAALPFAAGHVAYHPAGQSQERRLDEQRAALADAGVRVVVTGELFAGVTFTPMNLGVSFGTLRILDGAAPSRPATVRDVVVLEQTPSELSHVAGIVTAAPQTPLSHVNLKAKQNHTPNAYLAGATTRPELVALRDRIVRFEVAADGVHVEAASAEDVARYLEAQRPPTAQVPPRDLSRTEAAPLAALGFADSAAFGAKAANVAELRRVLPAAVVPDGSALPFAFYQRFMTELGLDDAARAMIAAPGFADDAAVREDALAKLRKTIKKAAMPAALRDAIGAVQAELAQRFGVDRPIRARSSTNNEDLPGFNGAGLYDSFTHRPDEGHLAATVQQVFASLWNFRAYEEREFYRVDHFVAAMGVLLHPNEDDELANGVAYTKNIYDPSWPGFYINAQVGENLVTNPEPGAVPEEFLISRIGEHGEYEVQYVSHSSLVPDVIVLLTDDDLTELVRHLGAVHRHFAARYDRVGDPAFAMDVEWKLRTDESLQIKQARPTVD